jgi:sugar-specific transcriptional regulator TrmB
MQNTLLGKLLTEGDLVELRKGVVEILIEQFKTDLSNGNYWVFDSDDLEEMMREVLDEIKDEIKAEYKQIVMKQMRDKMDKVMREM